MIGAIYRQQWRGCITNALNGWLSNIHGLAVNLNQTEDY